MNSVSESEPFLVEIFPNLVTEKNQYKIVGSRMSNYKIVNQFGQILNEGKINNNQEGVIDCGFLSPGTYYMVSQSENGLLLSRTKFMKI